MANTNQSYNTKPERVLQFIKSKLNHNSCRVADRPKLEKCREDLKAYGFLNLTQTLFIKDLMLEQQQRSKAYRERMKAKKEAQKQAQFEEQQTENEVAATNEDTTFQSLEDNNVKFEDVEGNTWNEVETKYPTEETRSDSVKFRDFLRDTPQINQYLQIADKVKEEAKQDAEELPDGNEIFKPIPVIDYNDFDPNFKLTEYLKYEDPHTVEINKTLYKRVSRLIEIAPKEINAYLLNVNQISLISSGEPHLLYLKGMGEHEFAIAFMRDTGGLCDTKWKRLITEFYNGANGF